MSRRLADQIEAGNINACCLAEKNLYYPEHAGPDTTFRRCRICQRRHFKLQTEGMRFLLRTEAIKRQDVNYRPATTARRRTLNALPGQVGARLRG